MTSQQNLRPIQLGLQVFSTEEGTQYHLLMAASMVVILPTLILFLAAQRQFIEGISRTGIRG